MKTPEPCDSCQHLHSVEQEDNADCTLTCNVDGTIGDLNCSKFEV